MDFLIRKIIDPILHHLQEDGAKTYRRGFAQKAGSGILWNVSGRPGEKPEKIPKRCEMRIFWYTTYERRQIAVNHLPGGFYL